MALFDAIVSRVDELAERAAARAIRWAEAAWAEFPDISLSREGNELVISGRGLMRRWLNDARMRLDFWKSE